MSCNIEDLDPSEIIFGCTDPLAINYDSSATVDDGTCIISASTIFGCTDPLALNYNSGATQDNNSCVYETCPTGITISQDGVVYYTSFLQQKGVAPMNPILPIPIDLPLNEKCCTQDIVGQAVIWDSQTNRCRIDLKPECIVYALSLNGIALNQNGQPISEECCTSLAPDYQWDQNIEYKNIKGGCVYTGHIVEQCNLDITNLSFNEDGSIEIDYSSFDTNTTSSTTTTPTVTQNNCVNIDYWYVYNPWPQGDPIIGYPEGSLLILHTTDTNVNNLQVGQQIALSGMDVTPINQTCYNYTQLTTLNLITKIVKILILPGNIYEIVTSVYFSNEHGDIYNNVCLNNISVSNSGKACVVYGQPQETITDTSYIPILNNQTTTGNLISPNTNLGDLINVNTILSNLTLNETCCTELGQGLWTWLDGKCYWKPPVQTEPVSIGVSENDIIVTDTQCTTLRACLSFFLERPDDPNCEPPGDVTANLNVYSGNSVNSGSLENVINVTQVSNYSLLRDGYCQWIQVCVDITGFEGIPFKLKLDLDGLLKCCDYEIYLDDISVDCTIQDSIIVPNRLECPGFTIRRVIDNKKSWVYNDGQTINRIFAPSADADIPWRYTNYFDQSGVYERHSKLVLNSKEMEITFNMCSGGNCDPKLNVYELVDYKKNFQNFWVKFIEQFVPATTIFVAGEKWCTREDQICPVIEPCNYDNNFHLSDLGISTKGGESGKPKINKGGGKKAPVYNSETKVPETKLGDYGSNRSDGPLIFDNLVASFVKPNPSALVNKELTLPTGLLPLLNNGMNNFRSKMVPTVYIQS